jgi:hypothetical protein
MPPKSRSFAPAVRAAVEAVALFPFPPCSARIGSVVRTPLYWTAMMLL